MPEVQEKSLEEKINEKYDNALADYNTDNVSINYILESKHKDKEREIREDAVKYIIQCLGILNWKEKDLSLSILGAGSSAIIFNFKNHSKDKHYVLKVSKFENKRDQWWNEKINNLYVPGVSRSDGKYCVLSKYCSYPKADTIMEDDSKSTKEKIQALGAIADAYVFGHNDINGSNVFVNPGSCHEEVKGISFDPGEEENATDTLKINADSIANLFPGGCYIRIGELDAEYDEAKDSLGFNKLSEKVKLLFDENYTYMNKSDLELFASSYFHTACKNSENIRDLSVELHKSYELFKYSILKKHLESIYKALLDSDSDSDSDDYSSFSKVISDEDYMIFCNKYLKDEEVLNKVLEFFKDEHGKIHDAAGTGETINKKDMTTQLLNNSKNIEKKNTVLRGAITVISILLFPLLLIKKGHGMAKSYKRIRALSPELSFSQAGIMAFKSSHCLQSYSRSKPETRVTALFDCLDRGIDNTKLENSN